MSGSEFRTDLTAEENVLSRRRFLGHLIAIIVCINLIVAGIGMISLYWDYQSAQIHAAESADNISLLLEAYVEGNISKLDMILKSCKDKIEADLVVGQLSPKQIENFFKNQSSNLSFLDHLNVADANGTIRYGTHVIYENMRNVADRDYFIRHKDINSDMLVISKALVSRTSGKLSMVFSRRINAPNGEFSGVLIGVVGVNKFIELFSRLSIGTHGVVLLRDEELGLIARYPDLVGSSMIGSMRVSKRFAEMAYSGLESGHFKSEGMFDDFNRMISFKKISNYPFYVMAGLASDDYLADWRADRLAVIIIMAVFLLLSIFAGQYFYFDWKRKNYYVVALIEQEQKFRIVADSTYDWEFWIDQNDVFKYNSPSCERITGYTREDFAADPGLVNKIVYKDDVALYDHHRILVNSVYKSEELTFRINHANGSVRWIEHVCQPVFDGIGNFIGVRGSNRDVTQRKMIEDAYKESQRMLIGIIDFLPDATIIFDNEKKVIAWNSHVELLTGISKERALGASHYDVGEFFYGVNREIFSDLLDGVKPELEMKYQHVIRKDYSICGETYIESFNNGAGAYLWLGASALFNHTGKRIGVIEVMRDITDQKRAELSVIEYAERLGQISDNINEVFWLYDLEARGVIYVNRAYEKVWGASCGTFLSDPSSYLNNVHPEDQTIAADMHARQLAGAGCTAEFRVVQDKGKTRWVHCHTFPISTDEGRIYRMVGIAHDVTDRHAVEIALHESEALYRSTINASPDALAVIDLEGKILFASDQTVHMYGNHHSGEILGRNMMEWIDPADHEKGFLNLQNLLHGKITVDREYRMKRSDGTPFIGETNGAILQGADGQVRGIVTVTRDITERKKIEAEVIRTANQKDVLMKELQHRVKNNLNVIAGLLTMEMPNLQDEHAKSVFVNARTRIVSMAVIYERLYRSDDIDNIELGSYIRQLIEFLIDLYKVSTGRITLNLSCEEIRVDLKRAVPLGLMVNELVSNSLKYAFPDGRDGIITVVLVKRNAMVSLVVEDDGIGLPENYTQKTEASLGVKLVNLLGEQIGARVTVHGERGTSVSIEFTL